MTNTTIAQVFTPKRIAMLFVGLMCALIVSSTAIAAAAPKYFDVPKPTSTSVCRGGSWTWESAWVWWWYPHRIHFKVWTPNWKKLGFKSYDQCIRYVTTPQPESRRDCRRNWYELGFNNRGQCIAYLNAHGGGYDGTGNPQEEE